MNINFNIPAFSNNINRHTVKRSRLAPLNKDTVSFSSNSRKNAGIRELSDLEFSNYRNIVYNKINSLPDDIRARFLFLHPEKENIFVLDKILSDEKLYSNDNILQYIHPIVCECGSLEEARLKYEFLDKILSDENILSNPNFDSFAGDIIHCIHTPEALETANIITNNPILMNTPDIMYNAGGYVWYSNKPESNSAIQEWLSKVSQDEKCSKNANFMRYASQIAYEVANPNAAEFKLRCFEKLQNCEALKDNENFMQYVGDIIHCVNNPKQEKLFDLIINSSELNSNPDFMKFAAGIVWSAGEHGIEDEMYAAMDKYSKIPKYYTDDIYKSRFGEILFHADTKGKAKTLDYIIDNPQIPSDKIHATLVYYEEVTREEIEKLNSMLGADYVAQMPFEDLNIAAKLSALYHKNSIDEISPNERKNLIRKLVSYNTDLFNVSDAIKKDFPLIPKNQKEYCTLLPAIISSSTDDVKPLKEDEIKRFENGIYDLSKQLANISDDEFKNLSIEQTYSRDEFIKDAFHLVSNLNAVERQKVFDYFGFEICKNKNAKVKINGNGYSIKGYPQIPNNNCDFISDLNTKYVVNMLKEQVARYTSNNPVRCTNKALEASINKILEYMPELRTTIGNIQAGMNGTDGSHDFDVFKHSLKVMQKIVENPSFEQLNKSDKKIMLIASLFHDISKKEGTIDSAHPDESSIDAFFIAKKLKLPKEEENKLYTLIKHHEWLRDVNVDQDEDQRRKNIQSTAFNFRKDNLFELALIFSHADLMAVKADNSFHDKILGDNTQSFSDAAEFYAQKIREEIEYLKSSQPLLPVTKMPAADKINEKIRFVNDDGSTNIKGVYKDKDGLVIIKFNEVEDFNSLGFKAKDSIPRFLIHACETAEQLVKFNAFSLPDSDVLLSASYSQNPKEEYRFYKPQGLILDCDTYNIMGGKNEDLFIGLRKSIGDYKNICFDDKQENGIRSYIASAIKKGLNLSDSEYAKFVEKNKNKPLDEVTPAIFRKELEKVFNTLKPTDERDISYNEILLSNPEKPMGVFAYEIEKGRKIGNPVEFLKRTSISSEEKNQNIKSVSERTDFLRKYALKNNLPFVVFGE